MPVKPMEWTKGKIPITISSGFSLAIWLMASTLLATLACVSITPFGTPVEPEVKITVKTSSGLISSNPSDLMIEFAELNLVTNKEVSLSSSVGLYASS